MDISADPKEIKWVIKGSYGQLYANFTTQMKCTNKGEKNATHQS